MKKNNKKLKLFSLIFLILFCLYFQTVAYSAINSTMTIKGDAYARVDADVRITNFKLSSSSSNSTSSYEEFSVNTIASKFNLLDSSSSIVFDVEVTNYGSSDVGILQLLGAVPTGLSYEIINYNLKDKICDDTGKCNQMAVKTFQIKFMGTPGEYEVNLELDFRTYHKVTYTDITNNNYPTEVIDGGNINITFKEDLKRVSVLSNGLEVNYYDQISNGQTITIENVSNDIEVKKKEPVAKLVSGQIGEVGSEVCIKDECFYIISNDGSTVTMLAKYNLHVGYVATPVVSDVNYNVNNYKVSPLIMTSNDAYVMPLAPPTVDDPVLSEEEKTVEITPIENPSGIQDASAKGKNGDSSYIGVELLSNNSYWRNTASPNELLPKYGTSFPTYIYDENSKLYAYVENYRSYLFEKGVDNINARLITYDELISLGCDRYSCSSAPSWVYSTSYWTGCLSGMISAYAIEYTGQFAYEHPYTGGYYYGVRPVIEMSVDDIYVPPVATVVSGDLDTVGSEICIKDECFYVISSDTDSVTMLAKYNLHVGNSVDEDWNVTPLTNPTGIQDETAVGISLDEEWNHRFPFIGTTAFSDTSTMYTGSIVEGYIDDYSNYLSSLGVTLIDSRLLNVEDACSLGCDLAEAPVGFEGSCRSAPSFVYSTSYWVISGASSVLGELSIRTGGGVGVTDILDDSALGVRPVITISKSDF